MPRFLMLRLDGPMQAWGTHTYEDFRTSNGFPTRSGLLGLLGACLGLERRNHHALEQLAQSLAFTVRVDRQVTRPGIEKPCEKNVLKQRDFHTVLDARKVDGSINKNPVVSHREYLYDAAFTIAVEEKAGSRLFLGTTRPGITAIASARCIPRFSVGVPARSLALYLTVKSGSKPPMPKRRSVRFCRVEV